VSRAPSLSLMPHSSSLVPPTSHSPVSRSAGYTHQEIIRAQTLAAGLVAVWGILFFGSAATTVIVISVSTAIAADLLIGLSIRRPVLGGLWHAALTGMLIGLTLPATVNWYVPAVGSLAAILLGKAPFGGLGHYVWHPALVGRVFVQLLFNSTLTLGATYAPEPVLTRDHLLFGSLSKSAPLEMASYEGWSGTPAPPGVDAFVMERPLRALHRFADGQIKNEGPLRFTPLLRDYLPPWQDTLLGAVPGGIGESSTLAVMVAGLYLIYRGYLRWQLPVALLAGAAVAAAILPVAGYQSGGFRWLPLVAVENGRAVGVAYILYHLTSGQLMIGAFILAGDMITSPKRARAQIVFGAMIGAATIFMRLYGLPEGECYWAILGANSFVPFIDRQLKRPVLGIETE
jgi:Na+-translocating ferredoxin:NAD+ oxidoreductase subunit D